LKPVGLTVGFLDSLFFFFFFIDDISTLKSPLNHSFASKWPLKVE
jgi:hypothetical protein